MYHGLHRYSYVVPSQTWEKLLEISHRSHSCTTTPTKTMFHKPDPSCWAGKKWFYAQAYTQKPLSLQTLRASPASVLGRSWLSYRGYLCFKVPSTAGTVQPVWSQSQFSQGIISNPYRIQSHHVSQSHMHRRCYLSLHRAREENMCAPPQDLCQKKESPLFLSHFLRHCFHPAAAPLTWVGVGQIWLCQASAALPLKPAYEVNWFSTSLVEAEGFIEPVV